MEPRNKNLALASLIIIGLALRIYSILPDRQEVSGASWVCLALFILILLIVYKLSRIITDSETASLFAVLLAIAVPIYSWKTVSQLTHTLAVLFFLLSLLATMQVKKFGWPLAIIPLIILSFVHVYALVLIPILVVAYILNSVLQMRPGKEEIILLVISILSISGIFVLFTAKPALLFLAKEYIIKNYYSLDVSEFKLYKLLHIAGLAPVYLGIIGAYLGFHMKKKSTILLLSAGMVFLFATLFNLIRVELGIPYLGLILSCLGAFFYLDIEKQIDRSRLKPHKAKLIWIPFIVVLILNVMHWLLTQV